MIHCEQYIAFNPEHGYLNKQGFWNTICDCKSSGGYIFSEFETDIIKTILYSKYNSFYHGDIILIPITIGKDWYYQIYPEYGIILS